MNTEDSTNTSAEQKTTVKQTNAKPRSKEPLRLVHYHPGYFRAQATLFTEPVNEVSGVALARAAAETTPGFRSWSHNPKTGSIVIQYQPGTLNVDELAEKIAAAAGLNGVVMDIHNSLHRKELVNSLLDAFEDVNEIVYHATGKKADLRELIPAGLLINSVIAFVLGKNRGERMPSWDSSLYRSYRIFMQTHKKELSKREKKRRSQRKLTQKLPQKKKKPSKQESDFLTQPAGEA